MNYTKYQHIEKLGSSETDGILDGIVDVFYKIDGTNACIFLKDDDTLGFGSRNRELSLDKDNASFMASILNDETLKISLLRLLKQNKSWIIYGEWLVPHTIKRYKTDAWRKFYVFDIVKTDDEEKRVYIPYDEYSIVLDAFKIDYIPRIKRLLNPTQEDVVKCLDMTDDFLLVEGLGEGIVIKNYNYRNKYGRTTWAKVLTEDFKTEKKTLKTKNHQVKSDIQNNTLAIEQKIVCKYLKDEHIYKEKSKLEEENDGWSMKLFGELLSRTFVEFFKDNWEIILKEMHYPTIDFRRLKSLVSERIKELLYI